MQCVLRLRLPPSFYTHFIMVFDLNCHHIGSYTALKFYVALLFFFIVVVVILLFSVVVTYVDVVKTRLLTEP